MTINNTHDRLQSEACLNELDPILQRILQDANEVTRLLNKDASGLGMEPVAIQEFIVSVGYRLVRVHTLNGPPLENKLAGAYHIGLIAFITTLFLQSGGRHFLRYKLVARCLESVIERRLSLDEEDQDIMLWLLFIGGISVLTEEENDSWLLLRITSVVQMADVKSWTQLQQRLAQFPWISSIHDEPGAALWRTAMARAITKDG